IAPVISCAVRFLENTEKEAVDDFGCVKVQLKLSDANCKGVMAIMDTGSDLSLMSQDWAYDRGRLHREDPWLDTHLRYPDTEFRRKRLESPVVFKTIDGNTAEVNEAITIETTVLKAKGRKETEHTSPVEYWITPLRPVDTPVLIGKPAMRKLGITLNVRSMKLGENLRGRMKAIVYRMYGLADKSIKEINTKTEMGPYVDEFKKAKCEIKPVEKLKEAVEKGDKIAEKEWDKRIQRETRWNLTREVEEKTPLL
ncbi:hypothetical protein ADUPG1_002947, partial [Aduncisulcus paluster]